MDFLKQLFLLEEALKTQPGLRSWATTGPRPPGLGTGSHGPCPRVAVGPVLGSPGQGARPRQLVLLLARGCCREEPFGESGCAVDERSIPGSKTHTRASAGHSARAARLLRAGRCGMPFPTPGCPVCGSSDASERGVSAAGRGARLGPLGPRASQGRGRTRGARCRGREGRAARQPRSVPGKVPLSWGHPGGKRWLSGGDTGEGIRRRPWAA